MISLIAIDDDALQDDLLWFWKYILKHVEMTSWLNDAFMPYLYLIVDSFVKQDSARKWHFVINEVFEMCDK